MKLFSLLVGLAAFSSSWAVVYRPHINHSMKNTTLRWKTRAKLDGLNVCAKETFWESSPKTYDIAWSGGAACVPTSIKMECCDGWATAPGERGCPQALGLLSAEVTGDRVQAGWWLRVISTAGLTKYLEASQDPVTVFAPVTSAISALSAHSKLLFEQGARTAYNLKNAPQQLLSHIVPGRIRSEPLKNNEVLATMASHLPIRINVFPNGMMTANCIPIVSKDVSSDGPLIHTLAAILPQSYLFHITDALLRNIQARRYASYVVQTQLEGLLRSEGPFTVFLPTDAAFDALGRDHAHALRYDDVALKALVKNHVLHGIHCSAMLYNALLSTTQADTIRSQCRRNGIYVKDAKIMETDLMAVNGVIHVIDRVLLPRRAMLLLDLLRSLQLTTMATLVERARLAPMFASPDTFTLFAPNNAALEGSLSKMNETEAGIFILNHMIAGRVRTTSFKNYEQIASKGGRTPFSVRTLRDKTLVDAAVVMTPDEEGLNGIIHVIDRALPPPRRKTIIQWLRDDGRYTEFLYALRTMQPSLYSSLDAPGSSHFTVFAVGDSYLTNKYNYLYYDARVLSNHILGAALVSEQVPANGRLTAPTIDNGQLLLVRRGIAFLAGSTHVIQKDILCSNGVIHIARDIILDSRHY